MSSEMFLCPELLEHAEMNRHTYDDIIEEWLLEIVHKPITDRQVEKLVIIAQAHGEQLFKDPKYTEFMEKVKLYPRYEENHEIYVNQIAPKEEQDELTKYFDNKRETLEKEKQLRGIIDILVKYNPEHEEIWSMIQKVKNDYILYAKLIDKSLAQLKEKYCTNE